MRVSKRIAAFAVALAAIAGATTVAAQQARKVDSKGVTSKVLFEHVVEGHLSQLNGKYKLRATEVTFAPGGYVAEHHHAGPGIRLVKSGQLTFVEGGKTIVYNTGDYYWESGSITHRPSNEGDAPVVLLNFELLPVDLQGSSTMAPK